MNRTIAFQIVSIIQVDAYFFDRNLTLTFAINSSFFRLLCCCWGDVLSIFYAILLFVYTPDFLFKQDIHLAAKEPLQVKMALSHMDEAENSQSHYDNQGIPWKSESDCQTMPQWRTKGTRIYIQLISST